MFALLADGGPFVWLLLVMSVASVAIVLERGWTLRRSRVMPQAIVDGMETLGAAALRGTCTAIPSPLARLTVSVLDHLRWPKQEVEGAVEVRARREVALMERGLVVLEIVVGTAPLIGLVGTLYGIIPLFVDFGKALSGDYALLAKGIGAALSKTLVGLLVAIPTLVAWSYFNKKVETLAVELEGHCDSLIRRHYLGDGIDGSKPGPTRP